MNRLHGEQQGHRCIQMDSAGFHLKGFRVHLRTDLQHCSSGRTCESVMAPESDPAVSQRLHVFVLSCFEQKKNKIISQLQQVQ